MTWIMNLEKMHILHFEWDDYHKLIRILLFLSSNKYEIKEIEFNTSYWKFKNRITIYLYTTFRYLDKEIIETIDLKKPIAVLPLNKRFDIKSLNRYINKFIDLFSGHYPVIRPKIYWHFCESCKRPFWNEIRIKQTEETVCDKCKSI